MLSTAGPSLHRICSPSGLLALFWVTTSRSGRELNRFFSAARAGPLRRPYAAVRSAPAQPLGRGTVRRLEPVTRVGLPRAPANLSLGSSFKSDATIAVPLRVRIFSDGQDQSSPKASAAGPLPPPWPESAQPARSSPHGLRHLPVAVPLARRRLAATVTVLAASLQGGPLFRWSSAPGRGARPCCAACADQVLARPAPNHSRAG